MFRRPTKPDVLIPAAPIEPLGQHSLQLKQPPPNGVCLGLLRRRRPAGGEETGA